ncbi:hypothetical protein ABZ567_28945 [Streptomyces sp. NPDC016459]|uniref:hypothetical protein n=1 Tax=Streptomyces sp. NPDC016459 TaxID=3157190 RepID=UPI0033E21C88
MDYVVPESRAGYRSLVEEWFVNAARHLSGATLNPFTNNLNLSGRGAVLKKSGVPYGEPGELWGSLWTAGMTRGRRTRVGRAWSPKEWESFFDGLEKDPFEVTLRLARLGADGYPAGPWLTVTAERDIEAPEWVRLMADRSSEEFFAPDRSSDVQRQWTEFLLRRLEGGGRTCLFGCVADDVDTTTRRTALEASLGLFQDETVVELDTTMRGYSWTTVCSPGVVARLGGPDVLRASGAFATITALADGGLVLQATDDMRDYTPDRIAMVFQQLRLALPSGEPVGGLSDMTPRLVFEAADAG